MTQVLQSNRLPPSVLLSQGYYLRSTLLLFPACPLLLSSCLAKDLPHELLLGMGRFGDGIVDTESPWLFLTLSKKKKKKKN